jgi:polar amino acid transport system substrate-binding protein
MSRILCVAFLFAAVWTGGALSQSATFVAPEVLKDLAPDGRLHAAINAGNVVLVQKDATGAVSGITVDLAHELARRLGVPADLGVFEAAGKVTDAAKSGAWDVAFVAIEPRRAEVIGFTAPYVVIEGTYMATVDSPLKTIADVDRDGIRIAVPLGSAYDLFLSRTLQHATLVRYPNPPQSLEGYVRDKIDVAAGVKEQLVAFAKSHPGYRVMDGHFQEIREAMGVPLGHESGLRYLREFVEEMKADGFVRQSLDRAGQTETVVAPPARN